MTLQIGNYSSSVSFQKRQQNKIENNHSNAQKKVGNVTFEKHPVTKSNDGKFSVSEAGKNLIKGVVSPVTELFKSKTNFITGVAMMAGAAALTVATGGAATPLLIAAGVAMGGVQAAKAGYKIATAKNGDDVEKAFYDVGGATSAIGLSAIGAKGALKQAGIKTDGLKTLSAVKKCFTSAKTTFTDSVNSFKQGFYKTHFRNFKRELTKSRKFKKLAQELRAEVEKTYEKNIKEIKDMLPEGIKGEFSSRLKGLGSIYDKLESSFSADKRIKKIQNNSKLTDKQKATAINDAKASEAKVLNDHSIAENRASDIVGARLNLKHDNPKEIEMLTNSILKAINEDKIGITVIRNYHGATKMFATLDIAQPSLRSNIKMGRLVNFK